MVKIIDLKQLWEISMYGNIYEIIVSRTGHKIKYIHWLCCYKMYKSCFVKLRKKCRDVNDWTFKKYMALFADKLI